MIHPVVSVHFLPRLMSKAACKEIGYGKFLPPLLRRIELLQFEVITGEGFAQNLGTNALMRTNRVNKI